MAQANDASTNSSVIGDLEIRQDLAFQHRLWEFQRVGWVIIATIVGAALLGLFGQGPLSRATAGSPSGPLWIEYERFGRLESPTLLRVHLGGGVRPDGRARLRIGDEYLANMDAERITPTPEDEEAAQDGVTYVFRIEHANHPVEIRFVFTAKRPGLLSGQITVNHTSLRFRQLIYP